MAKKLAVVFSTKIGLKFVTDMNGTKIATFDSPEEAMAQAQALAKKHNEPFGIIPIITPEDG